MSKEKLPRQINVLRYAEQGVEISGQLPVKNMARLGSLLTSEDGHVNVQLSFGIDSEGIKYVTGHISCSLELACQRCMEPMCYKIDDDLALSPILGESQAQSLPDRYDGLLATREDQELLPLIEDEILLRLPIVPLHDSKECVTTADEKYKKSDQGNRPFAEKLSELNGEENGSTKK